MVCLELDVGQPEHDAVITMHGLHVHAEALTHPGRDTQRPRSVDLRSEGGVHGHPPVAELIAKPLDHDGAVVRDVPGGLTLFVQVG